MARDKRHSAFLISILTVFGFVSATSAATPTITLNGLTIGVDEETGSILYLAYPEVGVILQATPQAAGLLDMAYPVDAFVPLRLASRFSKARIGRARDAITITWDPLAPSRGNFPMPSGKITAQIGIRAAVDGKSVILTCRVENQSSAPVPQVIFPDLRGLQPFDGLEQTRLRLPRGEVSPFTEPIRAPDSAPFYVGRGWKDYPPAGYYGLNALRWLDYGSLRGGLSVFQKKWGTPDMPGVRTHRAESSPNNLRLMWEHKASIQPGKSWESGEFWLTPHLGGWAKGIEVFRNYVREVNSPRQVPKHVRDGLGFQTIWMIQTAEMDPAKAAFRYADLPRVAQDAVAHGLDEVVPWGWCTYSTMPIPLRSELGGQQEFLDSLHKARQLGANIAPFISVQIVRNRYASRYGVPPSTSDWTYHPELIPNFRPFYTKFWDGASVESDNEVWKKDVETALTQWINLGLHSFCWDVFSTKVKEKGKPDLITLLEKVRTLAQAKDPESTFSAESVAASLEHDNKVVDYTWNWVDYVDASPILNVLRTPRLNCDVEDSPLVVKQAFCDGLYLNVMPIKPDQPNGTALISEVPSLSSALKETAALRKQFLPFFVDGILLGDSVLSAPTPAFVRGRQLGDRLLIAVLNAQNQARHISVRSSLDLWLPQAETYQIKYYDSQGKVVKTKSSQVSRWQDVTELLQPLELAFFEIWPTR